MPKTGNVRVLVLLGALITGALEEYTWTLWECTKNLGRLSSFKVQGFKETVEEYCKGTQVYSEMSTRLARNICKELSDSRNCLRLIAAMLRRVGPYALQLHKSMRVVQSEKFSSTATSKTVSASLRRK